MVADETAGIYARESPVLGRYVQLGIAQERVLSVEFPDDVTDVETDHELLDRIEAYLGGEPDEFADVTVAMTMPTTTREVLDAVREIPYGESASIEQLTRMVPGRDVDEESDLAAVRDALGENPAPILIPTHRVRGGRAGEPADVGETLRSIEGI
jgi:methylated-DNA-[protein]-cysteine S-methyltransferase